MGPVTLVCTGCGCLCDDVQVEMDSGRPVRIENACSRGAAYLQASFNAGRRTGGRIRGQPSSSEEAIDEAARLLSGARRRLIFGLDNSTLEAQALAIDLARKLGAVIDGASSASWGPVVERIIRKDLPTCSLTEVKDRADLLLYWGANPTATHPRHLSRHTYYAYAEYDPAGWYPRVTLATVDVRQTEFSAMSRPAFRIQPGGDRDLISGMLEEPPAGSQAAQLLGLLRQSRFCALFCGLGMVQALDGDLEAFTRMVGMLSGSIRVAVIPMIAETNMMGLARLLHEETGYVNSVSFAGGVSAGPVFSLAGQVRSQAADCILVAGADPFSSLPQSLLERMQGADIICLDHFATLTAAAAAVVVPTGVPGIESGGNMVRLDGEPVPLAAPVKGGGLTQEAALGRLLERVRP